MKTLTELLETVLNTNSSTVDDYSAANRLNELMEDIVSKVSYKSEAEVNIDDFEDFFDKDFINEIAKIANDRVTPNKVKKIFAEQDVAVVYATKITREGQRSWKDSRSWYIRIGTTDHENPECVRDLGIELHCDLDKTNAKVIIDKEYIRNAEKTWRFISPARWMGPIENNTVYIFNGGTIVSRKIQELAQKIK